jgi:DNA transformation protein and related proteins
VETQAGTVDFVLDQLSALTDVSARKMFGEYGLWYDGKLVALICDDQLFVKKTAAGAALIGSPVEAPPYPGAKPSFLIDQLDDRDWLTDLIRTTANDLPAPAPKRKPKARAK